MLLGVDPKHADQMVRGTVVLPHGTGKSKRVAVIAVGRQDRRRPGGRERTRRRRRPGREDLGGGYPRVRGAGRDSRHDARWSASSARSSGPSGLMPNPKAGTVTMDVGRAVTRDQGRQARVPRGQDVDHPRADRKDLVRREEAAENAEALHSRRRTGQAGRGQGKILPDGVAVFHDGARRRDRHGVDRGDLGNRRRHEKTKKRRRRELARRRWRSRRNAIRARILGPQGPGGDGAAPPGAADASRSTSSSRTRSRCGRPRAAPLRGARAALRRADRGRRTTADRRWRSPRSCRRSRRRTRTSCSRGRSSRGGRSRPREIQAIAELPSREELVAKLLFVMQSPIRRLVTVLNGPARNLVVGPVADR